jgi:hypothetical protein
VDGKFKGNESRFINHSCDPNCELQLWQVQGKMRIAICAIKDIAAEEPLSYDYQFETNEEDIFKCYCKTEKCRGTMAPKKKPTNTSFHTMNDRERKQVIDDYERRIKKTPEEAEVEEWSRSCTGKKLPGDPINEVCCRI